MWFQFLRFRRKRVIMLSSFVCSLFVLLCIINSGTPKKNHKFRSLSTEKINRLTGSSTSEADFRRLLAPLLEIRVAGTAQHDVVKDIIVGHMEGLGWDVEQDKFEDTTPHGQVQFTNIIATHNPAAPERLTIACHYDSKYYANIEFQGMTDSAVPCAMMIDLAYRMKDALNQDRDSVGSQVSLQFIFFDGEEAFVHWSDSDSIYGARHLAEKMEKNKNTFSREISKSDLERMKVLVLLDLIGTANPKFRNFFSNTEDLYERMKKIEYKLIKENQMNPRQFFTQGHSKYFSDDGPSHIGGIQDDHIPFLKKGVPILHLIPYPFPHVWHTKEDNISNMDFDTVDNLSKILRVFVAEYLHIKNP